jgi:biopolymer transport protein ExbB/TolQ
VIDSFKSTATMPVPETPSPAPSLTTPRPLGTPPPREAITAPVAAVEPEPLPERSFQVSWAREDIEQRFGFKGGRYTSVNQLLSLIAALLLTVAWFALMGWMTYAMPQSTSFTNMFLKNGNQYVQPATMFFFFWGAAILFVKSRKLKFQHRALELAAVPQHADFELNRHTAREVLERVHQMVDNPAHFLLLNRIERALSNLKNLGQVSDITSILQMQSENDEEQIGSSYSLLTGFIWAVPVLGFIGTVLGLSQAIGGFGRVIEQNGTNSQTVISKLKDVTSGLATAFETTLVALVAALILQLLTTWMQSREGDFLDACNDYCHRNVASKLRLHEPASVS